MVPISEHIDGLDSGVRMKAADFFSVLQPMAADRLTQSDRSGEDPSPEQA